MAFVSLVSRTASGTCSNSSHPWNRPHIQSPVSPPHLNSFILDNFVHICNVSWWCLAHIFSLLLKSSHIPILLFFLYPSSSISVPTWTWGHIPEDRQPISSCASKEKWLLPQATITCQLLFSYYWMSWTRLWFMLMWSYAEFHIIPPQPPTLTFFPPSPMKFPETRVWGHDTDVQFRTEHSAVTCSQYFDHFQVSAESFSD